ncbi:MAG: YARHG domain-containing protein [Treponema sp.]|nr:YARHG domain-containing protein [Treponema sp.]
MKIKKTVILLIVVFFSTSFLFSNDAYFFMSGGNLIPTNENDTLIEMSSEKINIHLQDDYYEVTVDFTFYNPSKATDLKVGFPFFQAGIEGHGKIWDFKCWTNDKETDFASEPIEKNWAKTTSLEYVNTRTIHFAANDFTTTRIYYKSEYGSSAPSYYIANYLYGTGSSWNKPIGSILLRIENNMKYQIIQNVIMAKSKYLKQQLVKTSDNSFELLLYNIEPQSYTEYFEIELSDVLSDDGPRVFPAYFQFNKKVVDTKEFKWYRKDQLRLVRNAIYALHGYKFKSADLDEYFSWVGKSWNPPYTINPDFSENDLSQIEKTNIQNLLEEEKKLKF